MEEDDDDRCDQCGSTDFTIEDDGRTYCANGHEQARGIITAEDDADYARKGKVVRKKEKKSKQKVSKVLRGVKAYQLFLQAWQHILWKQCHTLVHQLELPEELWTIVRDLWALWLSKLEHRLDRTEQGQHESDGDQLETSGENTDTTDAVDTDADERQAGNNSSKAARKGPKLIDTAALGYLAMILLRLPIELATILRWVQEEDIPFIRAIRHVPQEMKERLPSEYQAALDTRHMPRPDELQLAVYQRSRMYDVLFGMATPPVNHDLLFISYMRSLALPIEVYSLAQRLNRITKYSFAYQDLDAGEEAAEATSRLRRHATSYPEAQIISLIVTATKLLYPFDSDTVPRHPKSPNDLATLRMDWPAWLKAKTDLETASRQLGANGSTEGLQPGSEMAVTDEDVLNMNDTQLDQYLDWYQRMWLNPTAAGTAPTTSAVNESGSQSQSQSQSQNQNQEPNTIDQTILNLFPLQPIPSVEKTRTQHASAAQRRETLLQTRIERVQASLKPIRAIPPAEEEAAAAAAARKRTQSVLRPGARYPRYRWDEKLDGDAKSGWAQAAKVFHEEAAQVACLSVAALCRAVVRTEDLIEAWRRERRREEHFAGVDRQGSSGAPPTTTGAGAGVVLATTTPGNPSSSAALVRGLGDLELEDFGSSPAFAGDVAGIGEDDEGGGSRLEEDHEGGNDGSEGDIEMEMALEYLPEL
ncbi:uncharacterized protein A1O9_05775 [Exophiala aquamarina CBS 119918]|uniref:Uncharacterized protein n=1 Tax=Exophiala aquamarina CBS 119918 TaxID=1182545 RepID=A0A072PCP5_9EURO|nr:uncharacterized protein A1O9_05775 [Exophiala aquamarina CBS 119918]KEF57854.1 hypothetical protein A1O9_05775 [Exophiala aquamarina CBS 119918]